MHLSILSATQLIILNIMIFYDTLFIWLKFLKVLKFNLIQNLFHCLKSNHQTNKKADRVSLQKLKNFVC